MSVTTNTVRLVVYDLSMGMARQLGMGLLGVQLDCLPHTGVIIFGQEYFYGGGIQRMAHESVVRQFGISPMRTEVLGKTEKTQAEFHAFLDTIAPRFHHTTYDLFSNNCNHFSDEAVKFLLNGVGIPSEIVDLPSRVLATPMGRMLAPAWSSMQQRMTDQFVPFNAGAPAGGAAFGGDGIAPSATSAISAASARTVPSATPSSVQHRTYPRVPLVEALNKLTDECLPKELVVALDTLAKIMQNIINNPTEDKFRRISLQNAKFNSSLGRFAYGVSCLLAIGFELESTETHVIMAAEPAKWEKLILSDKIVTMARKKAIRIMLEQSGVKNADQAFGLVDRGDPIAREIVQGLFPN